MAAVRSSSGLSLSLFNHHTDSHYEALVRDKVLERARKLVRAARAKGLRALPASDPLVRIGMEVDRRSRVTKNCLGVLDLCWQAARRREWPGMIRRDIEEIRSGIRAAHGVQLQSLIWAGMGGSAEDKAMYNALGLLEGGVRVYVLDSTDPAKLQGILADMTGRAGSLPVALRGALVVGMAMGMTSYEPVLNLEKLHLLFENNGVSSASNFLYMTLPGSVLDRFATQHGYRRVELQLDSDNTTAGRHSGPLTRGSLYPLGLNGVDLEAWMAAAVLTDAEIQDAFRLAAFLHGNGLEARDQVILLLPRQWLGAGVWTKQDFEESLGKSRQLGIKIFPQQAIRRDWCRPVREEPRVFWAVKAAGCDNPDPASLKDLREAGYPVALLDLRHPMPLPKYMQWVHYVVFGLGWLRQMNFVTQPSVELYKEIANRVYRQAQRAGKIERTGPWTSLAASRYRARSRGGIQLFYDSLMAAGLVKGSDLGSSGSGAAEIFARAVLSLWKRRKIRYAELTFYGDMRYREEGRRLRSLLEEAAAATFGDCLRLQADVYEGPAMNHSYHEMIIGHGRCFSAVLLAREQASIPEIDYRSDYHRAQWLATKLALERRGRAVVALTFPDLSPVGLQALRSFFQAVARSLSQAEGC